MQFNLRQIGIDVEIKTYDRVVQHEKAATRGEPFDITIEGWGADYADPYNFLNVLLDGTRIQATNNVNTSYFNEPAYNPRMEQAARLSGDARYTAYAKLDADITRDRAPLGGLHQHEREDPRQPEGRVLHVLDRRRQHEPRRRLPEVATARSAGRRREAPLGSVACAWSSCSATTLRSGRSPATRKEQHEGTLLLRARACGARGGPARLRRHRGLGGAARRRRRRGARRHAPRRPRQRLGLRRSRARVLPAVVAGPERDQPEAARLHGQGRRRRQPHGRRGRGAPEGLPRREDVHVHGQAGLQVLERRTRHGGELRSGLQAGAEPAHAVARVVVPRRRGELPGERPDADRPPEAGRSGLPRAHDAAVLLGDPGRPPDHPRGRAGADRLRGAVRDPRVGQGPLGRRRAQSRTGTTRGSRTRRSDARRTSTG